MPEIVKLYQSRRNWLPDPVVQCCSEDGKYHPYCKLKRRRTDNLPAATPVNFSGFRCILLNRPAASDVPRKSHRHLPGCAETAHGRSRCRCSSTHGAARQTLSPQLHILPVFLAIVAAFGSSKTQRWLAPQDAADRGYLVNLETPRGRPARIVLGDPMPEMVKLLPEPAELAAESSVALLPVAAGMSRLIPIAI